MTAKFLRAIAWVPMIGAWCLILFAALVWHPNKSTMTVCMIYACKALVLGLGLMFIGLYREDKVRA
jgi:hypothetical protein